MPTRLFRLGLRWLPIVAVASLLLAGVTYVYASAQPRVYESSTTLNVSQAAPTFNSLLVAEQLARYYAYRATTRPVADAVRQTLALPESAESIQQRISSRSEPSSSLFAVSARSDDPEQAAAIAGAVASILQEESASTETGAASDRSLEGDLGLLRTDIDSIEAEIARLQQQPASIARDAQLATLQDRLVARITTHADLLRAAMDSGANSLQVVVPALPAESPVEPRPLFMAIQAALLMVLIVGGIAFLVEYFRTRPQHGGDLESWMGTPTLASITELTDDVRQGGAFRLVTLLYPRSPAADAYRRLRANIEIAAARKVNTLLLTSAVTNQGRSVIAANLAIAFAQTGKRVVLLDADLHEPSIHELFGLSRDRGLTSLLTGADIPPLESVVHLTQQPGLGVLPCGPTGPNPGDLISSDRMRDVLTQLAARVDLLIVDGPPLPAILDSAILASRADGTLVVVDSATADRRALLQVREALHIARAEVLGTVLFGRGRGSRAAHPKPQAVSDAPSSARMPAERSGPL